MNNKEFRRGYPFDVPKHPTAIQLMLGWFFDQINLIVDHENHVAKFDGGEQVLEILHEAAYFEEVNVAFSWDRETNIWYIENPPDCEMTEEDFCNLPLVAYRFSKIYRHHAKEYGCGEDEAKSLCELMEGAKDGRKD